MNISQEFAPPYKLVIPYFIVGVVFYLVSILYTFGFDVNNLHYQDPTVLAWVHLYLLGFVMVIIFGAMAQLLPVVLEVGHFKVTLFYVIWPLLALGTLLMVGGFVFSTPLLPLGGTLVLISMMVFIFDIFMTLKAVKKFNLAITTVLLANISLFVGVFLGIIMALGYAGYLEVDFTALLKGHIYLVIGGYIIITVMGLSMILIPMFGLAHGFSDKPVKVAVSLMSVSVVSMLASVLLGINALSILAYVLSVIAVLLYLYQVAVIYKSRARKIQDIYSHSLMMAFGSLLVAIVLGVIFFLSGNEKLLQTAMWLIFAGFFGLLISGHLYKIVPFLVWFEKFSALVGKEKVPMLADMIPDRATYMQLIFTSIGVVISALGILFSSDELFKAGISFSVMGGVFFMYSVIYILKFKG
jgi:hypothetical protein